MPASAKRITELVTACAATAVFLFLAGRSIGIDPFDETIYLNGARWIHLNLMLTAQSWAPLYIYWYRILAAVVPNPEARYFVSWGVMVTFLALVPVLLRIPGALVYLGVLLTLPVMLPVPYVSLFAGWPILLGLCLFIRTDRRAWSFSSVFALATVACFIGAFSRPELQDGVIAAAVLTIVCLVFEKGTRTHIVRSAALAAAVIVIALIIHYAALHTSGNRSGFAFVDSVNLRASEAGLLKPGENSWTSTFAQREFGLDRDLRAPQVLMTISEYFRKNPRLFISHMVDNARDPRFIVLFGVVVALAAIPWLRARSRAERPASMYMLVVSLSAFLGILFIYPREHYAMSMFPTLILYAVYVLKPQLWPGPLPLRLAGFALLLALCTWVSVWRLQQAPFLAQREQLNSIACARDADLSVAPSHPVVYDSRRGVAPYMGKFRLGTPPENVGDWDKFKVWVKANNPGWISMTSEGQAILGIPNADIDNYIVHDLGFVPHPCPQVYDMRIFVNPHP